MRYKNVHKKVYSLSFLYIRGSQRGGRGEIGRGAQILSKRKKNPQKTQRGHHLCVFYCFSDRGCINEKPCVPSPSVFSFCWGEAELSLLFIELSVQTRVANLATFQTPSVKSSDFLNLINFPNITSTVLQARGLAFLLHSHLDLCLLCSVRGREEQHIHCEGKK